MENKKKKMENKKQVSVSSSSSSSFTTDLFGAKDSLPPSSTGFASLFRPPASVGGRKNTSSELTGGMQKEFSQHQMWSAKQGTSDNMAKNSEGVSSSIFNKERSEIFQERMDPSPLSSSLHYGGQEDMYIKSSSAQTSGSDPVFKKDVGGDDSNGNNSQSFSRGDWWEGSVFY